jgi:hypothetical protein
MVDLPWTVSLCPRSTLASPSLNSVAIFKIIHLIIWMARSGQREILEVTALRHWLLSNQVPVAGNVWGCRNPLEGAVVDVCLFWVKTLGHHGLGEDDVYIITLLETSLWSSDFPRTCFVIFHGKSWFFFYPFGLSLICYVSGLFLHHLTCFIISHSDM